MEVVALMQARAPSVETQRITARMVVSRAKVRLFVAQTQRVGCATRSCVTGSFNHEGKETMSDAAKESTASFKRADAVIQRGVVEQQKPKVPVSDLSGKGVFDAISSNRSKMNDQNS